MLVAVTGLIDEAFVGRGGRAAARTHVAVAEELRRQMQLRLVLPGDCLPPERELMRTFSAGRETVQRALALLVREGLVIKRRGRSGGAFVTDALEHREQLTLALARVRSQRRAIEEALEYRAKIEPAIVVEACARRSDEYLAEIRDTQRELTAAETEAQFMHFDNRFHIAIAQATENRFLVRATTDIRAALNDALWVAGASRAWLGRTVAQHDLIVDAIEHRDRQAALRAATAHTEHTRKVIEELLESA
jgi:DNA-binding FadR family transcriptional regulator